GASLIPRTRASRPLRQKRFRCDLWFRILRPMNVRPARAPAPDLARGVMLLLIVLPNSAFYLHGAAGQGPHPLDGSTADSVAQAIFLVGVDLRVYLMFALLFGYSLVMIMRSRTARGASEEQARRQV